MLKMKMVSKLKDLIDLCVEATLWLLAFCTRFRNSRTTIMVVSEHRSHSCRSTVSMRTVPYLKGLYVFYLKAALLMKIC